MQALPFAMLVGLAVFFTLAFGATIAGVFRGPARAALGGSAGGATGAVASVDGRSRAKVRAQLLPARGILILGVTTAIALLAFAVPPHRPVQFVAG